MERSLTIKLVLISVKKDVRHILHVRFGSCGYVVTIQTSSQPSKLQKHVYHITIVTGGGGYFTTGGQSVSQCVMVSSTLVRLAT
jgi:hypothetical protein